VSTSNPQVSVIIPTYNRQHCISQAIDSVWHQTYGDYELIVVDDASTDGTADWIAANYRQIQLVPLSQNCGAAAARNQGIAVAKGEFIAFLDSDDRWEPNFLSTHIHALQSNPDAVSAYCNYSEVRQDGSQSEYNLKPWRIYPDLTHHLLMETTIHSMSLVTVRRDALLKAGPLNEILKISHDRELYLRLLYLGKIVHIPHNLVYKFTKTGSLLSNYRRWSKETLMLLDLFFADARSQPYKHLEAEARSRWRLKLAKHVWQERHDILFTITMLLQAMYFSPRTIGHSIGRRLKNIPQV